ncbi:MAG: hypothetical protein ACK2T3_15530, partial [Candidatus Promineifilaceae bacterium]
MEARSFDKAVSIAVVVLVLGLGTAAVVHSYYQVWKAREDLFYDSDADLVAVAEYLSSADLGNQQIYLAAQHYRHPTLAFLSDYYDQVKWLPEGEALVLPPEGEALIVYPHSTPAPEWAQALLAAGAVTSGPAGPDGEPLYEIYRVPSSAEPAIDNPLNYRFGDAVTLLGYSLGSTDSGTVPLLLNWRIENSSPESIQPFVHLEDQWGHRWSQVESFGYPSEQWSPGEVVTQRLEVPVTAGMPPGTYQTRIGFFNTETGEQLGVFNNEGQYVGSAVTITGIPIDNIPLPDPLPEPAHPLNQPAGSNLTLVGYERAGDAVETGANIDLSLWWYTSGPLQPAAVRLELVGDGNAGPILQPGKLPVHGTYPFESWGAPQFVIDHLNPRIADNTQPGEYLLRMRLLDAGDQTITTADLGSLTIVAADHLYTPPDTSYPLEATFGGEIELLGYDLEQLSPTDYKLRLVWRALEQPSDSYTVFVHVLNQDGTCCAWQQDIQPQQGSYPTDRWLSGEVVVDEYQITMPEDFPAGDYQIEMGLYLPSNGLRLSVDVPGMRLRDVLYLTQPVVVGE